MKNLLFTIMFSLIATISFAQVIDLEQFYMPQLQSKEECAKYIGKKVCTFDYFSSTNQRYRDSKKFDEYRTDATIYTIKKIKFGKQIILTLDNDKYTKKVKINNGGPTQYNELSSCNIFFLCDDFEAYKNKLVGTVYKNKNNEDVAVLENIELIFRNDDDPILVSTLKSKLNNEEFLCFSHDASNLCNRIGTIISHPKVKDSYRILSIKNNIPVDGKFKYIYAERPWYIYEDITSGKKMSCSVETILTSPFEIALSGKYISILSKVEKPANPEIRHGETITISSNEGVSKFSYKDNIIDLLIFANDSHFNLVMQNISESSIKIIWDDAVFVNFDGSTEKVMHKGIKYSEKNSSQPATTIIKNAKWEDTVVPTHLVYYREKTDFEEGGWDTYSMYPEEKGLEPGQIKLMLPIQIKDVINEYIFIFDVKYIFDYPENLKIDLPKLPVLMGCVN
ncbi:MAG: hypothetical protein IJZ45_01320 [Bacteroidaceae bacterium]|nr:hypothetical protein [Bacteroidaceae bacterium]